MGPQKGAIFQTFQSHIVSPKTGPKGGIVYHDRPDLPIWTEIKKEPILYNNLMQLL